MLYFMFKDRRAISPLIAILLLIAIAVAGSGMSFSWIMSLQSSQYVQAQTQIRIDMVQWNISYNKVIVTVRNTGSTEATIETISLRKNESGAEFITDTDELPVTIHVQDKINVVWDVDLLNSGTSYVIRITTSTGFYTETVSSTPSG
jgi:flagellin-like protein